jgi:restriction endonuclease Mrr
MAENHIDARITEYSATYTDLERAIEKEARTAVTLKEASEVVTETKLRSQITLIRRHVGRSPASDFTEEQTIRKCAENNALRELAEEDHKQATEALAEAREAMTGKFGEVVAEFKPAK